MCGRFMFQPTENAELNRIFQLAKNNGYHPKTGEIFPTDDTALVIAGLQQVKVVAMKWGYPGFKPGQSIINARSETVTQKQMFARGFKEHRCVYPTTGFFEWTADKQRYWFNYGEEPETMYIAGFYDYFDGIPRSCLLTTKPNDSVIKIHDRMPLILSKNQIKPWLYDDKFALDYLNSKMPMLNSVNGFPQFDE